MSTVKNTGLLKVTYIVNSVFSSRTYILSLDGHKDFWLVDCGSTPLIMERLTAMSGGDFRVNGVLLTHAHYDHIYGLPSLKELFPDVNVYTNEAGREALADERRNMSKYHGDPIVFKGDNVVVCDEGTEIELFDGIFAKIYETPGHNPSCLTFDVKDYLFTGDAWIPGVKVVTTLPGGDKVLAKESEERIKKLAYGNTVMPGHD